jgi:hypothetical protein
MQPVDVQGKALSGVGSRMNSPLIGVASDLLLFLCWP